MQRTQRRKHPSTSAEQRVKTSIAQLVSNQLGIPFTDLFETATMR
jgi:hypothetical protein